MADKMADRQNSGKANQGQFTRKNMKILKNSEPALFFTLHPLQFLPGKFRF